MRVFKIVLGVLLLLAGLFLLACIGVALYASETEFKPISLMNLFIFTCVFPIGCGVWLIKAAASPPAPIYSEVPPPSRSVLQNIRDQFSREMTTKPEEQPDYWKAGKICWAGFLLPLPWLFVHRYYFTIVAGLVIGWLLSTFVSNSASSVGIFWSMLGGSLGHRAAWQSGRYRDFEHYQQSIKHWHFWGIASIVVVIAFLIVMFSRL